MTEQLEPNIGERRVFDYKGVEVPRYDIQEYRECTCKYCPFNGHWNPLEETDDKQYAYSIVSAHNRALMKV